MQMTIYPWGEMFSVLSALSRIVPSKLLKKINVTNPEIPIAGELKVKETSYWLLFLSLQKTFCVWGLVCDSCKT